MNAEKCLVTRFMTSYSNEPNYDLRLWIVKPWEKIFFALGGTVLKYKWTTFVSRSSQSELTSQTDLRQVFKILCDVKSGVELHPLSFGRETNGQKVKRG